MTNKNTSVKLLQKQGCNDYPRPVMCFLFYNQETDKIFVYATDIWNLEPQDMVWASDKNLDGEWVEVPALDMVPDENIWEFAMTEEGEMAAHKKMCEIYAAELERIHKS